jgi:hypothetical protein
MLAVGKLASPSLRTIIWRAVCTNQNPSRFTARSLCSCTPGPTTSIVRAASSMSRPGARFSFPLWKRCWNFCRTTIRKERRRRRGCVEARRRFAATAWRSAACQELPSRYQRWAQQLPGHRATRPPRVYSIPLLAEYADNNGSDPETILRKMRLRMQIRTVRSDLLEISCNFLRILDSVSLMVGDNE